MDSEKDSRNQVKHKNLKKEKWQRKVVIQEQIEAGNKCVFQEKWQIRQYKNHASSESESVIEPRNKIANPSNYKINKCRSESPPAKRYRTNKGINNGKSPGCSYCRPEIAQRMSKTSMINKDMKFEVLNS